MRGIDRILAAFLLAGAVAGTAFFARHLGSVPEQKAISLPAPTPQHLTATVRAPLLVPPEQVKPRASTALPRARAAGATERSVTPAAPAATRATTPTRATDSNPAPAPPVQQPTERRILAAVPFTPTTGTGHARARSSVKGREKGLWAQSDDGAPAPAAALSVPQPLLQLAPSVPFNPSPDGGSLVRGGKARHD